MVVVVVARLVLFVPLLVVVCDEVTSIVECVGRMLEGQVAIGFRLMFWTTIMSAARRMDTPEDRIEHRPQGTCHEQDRHLGPEHQETPNTKGAAGRASERTKHTAAHSHTRQHRPMRNNTYTTII